MSTETNQDETSQPPFQFGDVVRHQSGDVIKVATCVRVVAHSHLRWAVYDVNGNRFWARNCGLVERPRATLGGGTADGERPIVTPLTAAQRSGVDELPIRVKGAAEFIADANLEPGTINDQGSFEPTTPLGKLFGREGRFVPAENAKPYDPVAELKSEIETLAKQRDEAREELHEATAEFVRALSAANDQRDSALSELSIALDRADGWREVVAKCERLLKMNGRTPTDPNDSAVPLQLEHRLKSLALAENVIRDAKEVLKRKET
jgi:hypothetical protein